jgi:DNA-binding transcriptional LysR family regulator
MLATITLSWIVEFQDMNLGDLRYFLAVAQHGNVTRASEELDLSPSALSKCLRRLQDSIGVVLVERHGRGIKLTPAGHVLLLRVQSLDLAFRDVEQEAREIATGGLGTLRVGISTDFDEVPALLGDLVAHWPKLRLTLELSNNDVLIPLLQNGDLDLVLNTLPRTRYEGTTQQLLGEDEWIVAASKQHPLAREKRVALATAGEQRWAITTHGTISRSSWEHTFRHAGLPIPPIGLETRSVRARMFAVARSHMLCLMDSRTLRRYGNDLGVKQLPVKELTSLRTYGAILRGTGYVPPAAQQLIDAVRKTWHEDRIFVPNPPRRRITSRGKTATHRTTRASR